MSQTQIFVDCHFPVSPQVSLDDPTPVPSEVRHVLLRWVPPPVTRVVSGWRLRPRLRTRSPLCPVRSETGTLLQVCPRSSRGWSPGSVPRRGSPQSSAPTRLLWWTRALEGCSRSDPLSPRVLGLWGVRCVGGLEVKGGYLPLLRVACASGPPDPTTSGPPASETPSNYELSTTLTGSLHYPSWPVGASPALRVPPVPVAVPEVGNRGVTFRARLSPRREWTRSPHPLCLTSSTRNPETTGAGRPGSRGRKVLSGGVQSGKEATVGVPRGRSRGEALWGPGRVSCVSWSDVPPTAVKETVDPRLSRGNVGAPP